MHVTRAKINMWVYLRHYAARLAILPKAIDIERFKLLLIRGMPILSLGQISIFPVTYP